jgi:hypothetical protein
VTNGKYAYILQLIFGQNILLVRILFAMTWEGGREGRTESKKVEKR